MDDDGHRTAQHCPHVNRDDARCGSRFNLGRINQAFDVCFGSFHTCPMFHRINREAAHQEEAASATPLITITAHGRQLPLRQTGS